MREIIEKYIQFAIDNGYENNYVLDFSDQEKIYLYYIIQKEFIQAIVRGVYKNNINELTVNEITFNQAIAIRDGKLEEFINNLLTNQL